MEGWGTVYSYEVVCWSCGLGNQPLLGGRKHEEWCRGTQVGFPHFQARTPAVARARIPAVAYGTCRMPSLPARHQFGRGFPDDSLPAPPFGFGFFWLHPLKCHDARPGNLYG
jgi:hypothetical protein